MDSTKYLQQMLQGEKPDGIVNGWEPFGIVFDPLNGILQPARPGQTNKDPFGVTLHWPEDQPGVMPLEGEGYIVCTDVTEWRETVKAPDVAALGAGLDWSGAHAQSAAFRAQGKLAVGFMPIGLFELSHNLMGFEDCLMNFLLEPEAMHELIDYLVEYRMECLKWQVKEVKPDMMLLHDDWGAKEQMLISPDTWREFFKPGYARMYGYLRDNGIPVMHHADSFLEPIVEEMEEIGITIWQGVLPQNDIPAIQKRLKGNMLLMGGIDAGLVDRKDFDEAAVRAEIRRVCDEYLPGGNFFPAITYGAPGAIFPGVGEVIYDEIAKYPYKK